jgi:hypothetical protein
MTQQVTVTIKIPQAKYDSIRRAADIVKGVEGGFPMIRGVEDYIAFAATEDAGDVLLRELEKRGSSI